ncbi:MAG: P1 family peptidase [Bacteroidia bacterium]
MATDAPVNSRNLRRMAKRAIMGLAKTGGIASNGSGDYVIAFSSNPEMRTSNSSKNATESYSELRNDRMSPLFMATIEATEEAILNSLFAATPIQTVKGREIQPLPVDKVLKILKKYGRKGK